MSIKPVFNLPKMGQVNKIHFVGIGGAGMCGIAEVLHNEGYTITGSDLSESKVTARLVDMGIQIFFGHHQDNIQNIDVVVRSTAVKDDNPEVVYALAHNIPVIPRAVMLAELMRFRYGIAVAGTHGKTTTTSLVSSLLAEAGLDPSFVIGGKLNSLGSNAKLGNSPYLVAEADESDASFLYLKPMIAIVTNIDADHMETYQDDFECLKNTFIDFLHHLPFYGTAILCVDDPVIREILPRVQRPIITYGLHESAMIRAVNWRQEGIKSYFQVKSKNTLEPLNAMIHYPGQHNVQNALAAIAVAMVLEVNHDAIMKGISNFQGVGRRFQLLGKHQFSKGDVMIVDDYGHHPNEIRTTQDAFRRAWPDKPLVHVFQPHRYSRTQALFSDFVDVLSTSDSLVLLDIYSAGELPIPGVTIESLAEAISNKNKNVKIATQDTLESILNTMVDNEGVILMQGAGSIGGIAQKFAEGKTHE